MGILLGVLTALTWGGSDFLARFSTRRIGTLRTTLYMHLIGFLLLTISLPWLGGWGHLFDGSGWHPWAWGVLAGFLNAIGTLALYRSFEIGKMAVVAPLSASYPVLTSILSFFSGEHLTPLRAAGIVLMLAGAIVVVRGEVTPTPEGSTAQAAPKTQGGTGVAWALTAAGGFGVLFWLLGMRVVPAVGYASTVWMIRLTCSLLALAALRLAKQPIGIPRQASVVGGLLAMGLLDTSAYVLNNRGMQLEQVSVVSVLASLYGAVTVALAAIFLREHISRWQWVGVVAIFGGILLVSR
jgi:drug/metabolite transporter (DMT)-like permease